MSVGDAHVLVSRGLCQWFADTAPVRGLGPGPGCASTVDCACKNGSAAACEQLGTVPRTARPKKPKAPDPIVRPFIADTARRVQCLKRGRFKRESMKDIEQAMARTGMKPG